MLTDPFHHRPQLFPMGSNLVTGCGSRQPVRLAQLNAGGQGLVLEQLCAWMVFVETPWNGLEFFALNREACLCHGVYDSLQLRSAIRNIHCGPETCQLGRRVGMVAAADQQAVGTDLEIEPTPSWLAAKAPCAVLYGDLSCENLMSLFGRKILAGPNFGSSSERRAVSGPFTSRRTLFYAPATTRGCCSLQARRRNGMRQ